MPDTPEMPDLPAVPLVPDAREEPEVPAAASAESASPAAATADTADTAAAEPAAAVAESPAAPSSDPAWCAAELKRRFPALFTGGPKPIKLRVQQDIQQRAPGVFTRQALSGFLRRLTGSTSYLIALTRATQRFDLDGQPAGELSSEHREAAVLELERRRGLRQEREEREMQERRNRATLLRDFERTTLTPANFCALKGLEVAQLEPLLAQARDEAAAWAERRPMAPPPGPRPEPNRDRKGDRDRPPQREHRPGPNKGAPR